jgi:hypothetical protein
MQLELVAVGTFVAHIASEDDEQQPRCGSMSDRITVPRDRYIEYRRLMNDYFFDPHMFVTSCFVRGMCNMIHTVIHTFQTGLNIVMLPGFECARKCSLTFAMSSRGAMYTSNED